MNYLASPAAGHRLRAGRHDGLRLRHRAARARTPTATTSSSRTSGRRRPTSRRPSRRRSTRRCSPRTTPTSSTATSAGSRCRRPRATPSTGTPTSTYVRKPPYFDGMPLEPTPVTDITGARVLAKLGDSVTTDHISPAGSIKADSPAGAVPRRARRRAQGLQLLRLAPRQPRGDDPRHLRQHPAAEPAARRRRGRLHPRLHSAGGEQAFDLRRVAQNYQEAGIPLVVLGGKEYGSGSSRDWAAKGTALLGVRAVIAESFERIHRSNLIGMGVLPLQFPDGRERRVARARRHRDVRHHRRRGAQRGRHPEDRHGHRHQRGRLASRVRRASCASTPPVRPTTTATAASCSTCCARSSADDRALERPHPTHPRVVTGQ